MAIRLTGKHRLIQIGQSAIVLAPVLAPVHAPVLAPVKLDHGLQR